MSGCLLAVWKACEFGSRSWCMPVGLSYATSRAPLADVYAAYRQVPLPEARAALVMALGRQKGP